MKDKRKYKCENQMLECINSYDNLGVNGSKDSQYNDLISFEKHFNGWDSNLIILKELSYGHEGGVGGRPYVNISIIGIFDNIGMFARKLQKILPNKTTGKTISCMDTGEDLSIDIFDDTCNCYKFPTYRATTHQLNQISSDRHIDGMKFHIIK